MKLSEFDYKLPQELIAQTPITPRDNSRLLVIDKKTWNIEDKIFFDLIDYLWENDVVILNNTRVINARLIWELRNENWTLPGVVKLKSNCEIFLHKQLWINTWDCLVYPGKKMKIWTIIYFEWLKAEIKEISTNWRIVEFNLWWEEFFKIIEKLWKTPLPPYIKEKLDDSSRYQTVYSKTSWSVAAPTAWLHFTSELIEKLKVKWVKFEEVLLHVWLWTFKWVETENILDHKMHSEYISIDKETSLRLNKYKKEWKNIISVWTTSIRVIESFTDENWILWYWEKETSIFIYPWYKWRFVDNLITNFHLPKSTLLMLVSSLAWKENIKKAYEHAISNKYRFFSFWDAMFIKENL